MNSPVAFHEAASNGYDVHAEYISRRVVDTLLREDVRQCVSRGTIVDHTALPAEFPELSGARQQWLQVTHLGSDQLWIPVTPSAYMQTWRSSPLPLLRYSQGRGEWLVTVKQILGCFRQGLADAQGYLDFEAECQAAIEHRTACETERQRWFDEWREHMAQACGADLPSWDLRLQHYDRLAAFQDHPYYPTARAKLGFGIRDLTQYAPEFQPRFKLNWLAVPKALYHQQGSQLPPAWPGFPEVGLDAHLDETHRLVPVHPFVWENELETFLSNSNLDGQCLRAPLTALLVEPTLSVRTLALCAAPAWHIKVPLTIRTLGGRNIRTIKPSTISDGHLIQTLLGHIVAGEAMLDGRVLLSAEDTGAHVARQNFLGFILRRYPQQALQQALQQATMMPVAALAAKTPAGHTVMEEAAQRYYGGDMQRFFDDYLALTLQLHLTLWIRYGIALESNQQNSMLVLQDAEPRMRLLLKDNDAARIDRHALQQRWPALAAHIAALEDQRILVEDALPLAQMFTTITLQLNIAALVESLAQNGHEADACYTQVRGHIVRVLDELAAAGEDVAFARQLLLDERWLYIKYLLVAATLEDKQTTGAADVNKYYGRTAPNFLQQPFHD